MFALRLDLIMELTGTTASVLGKVCALDPSHVSRLRRGSRPLPKNPVFLPAMSACFARRIRAEYQKNSLLEIMGLDLWPEDQEQAASLIEQWLRAGGRSSQVEPILRSFTCTPGDSMMYASVIPESEQRNPMPCYYGPEGKREAVIQLFSLTLREREPQTLLLFSDEEMGWMYEDPDFSALWAKNCVRVLLAGNRVKIIHAIHRNTHEMMEGVAKWVPLYMTGQVEPYYYPKLRDGVFQRTLFLAPQTAGLVSESVNRKTDGMLHALYQDPRAISALVREYENLLELCRPLMRILNAKRASEFWSLYASFLRAEGEMICLTSQPTLATMPEGVAESMQERAPESRILDMRNQAAAALSDFLSSGRYTELIADPLQDVGSIPVPFADLMGAPGLCYTPEEYRAHRANLVVLAKENKHYHLRAAGNIPGNLTLCGKEDRGILMCKNDAPGVIFAFDETNMTSAFWEYLCRQSEQSVYQAKNQ